MDAHYDAFAEAVREAIGRATLVPVKRISVARAELGGRARRRGAARAAMSRPQED